jgi:hypothetical protein
MLAVAVEHAGSEWVDLARYLRVQLKSVHALCPSSHGGGAENEQLLALSMAFSSALFPRDKPSHGDTETEYLMECGKEMEMTKEKEEV